MKKLLIIAFGLIPLLLIAQKDLSKKLKKLGLQESEVVYTDESILFFPRIFIYDVDAPDSVCYLSCFSTDRGHLTEYFEDNSKPLNFVTESIVLRVAAGYTDTIKMESLATKLNHFKSEKQNQVFSVDIASKYVIIYYWCTDIMDRDFIKHFKFFKKYADKHPEKHIEIVAISTDNP